MPQSEKARKMFINLQMFNPVENDEINPIKRDNLAKKKGSELV